MNLLAMRKGVVDVRCADQEIVLDLLAREGNVVPMMGALI